MTTMRGSALLCLLAVPPTAHAIDFCAQDDSQFASALALQEIAPGPHTIRLAANTTFHLANTALDDASYPFRMRGLTLDGGYDATCENQITQDAASSVLDGAGAGAAQGYAVLKVDAGDRLTVRTLTIANLARPLGFDVGGDHARLRWQHVRVVDGASVALTLHSGSDARFEISDSLFARMSGTVYDAALDLGNIGGDDLRIDLVNTTVTACARSGVSVYNPTGTTWLYNDILYGNGTGFVDLELNEAVWAFNDTIGSHGGSFLPGSANNLSTDPLFVSATDYNLQLGSPARDSGTLSLPLPASAFDIEGGARVVGGQIDRGAFENDSSGGTILLVTTTADAGAGSLRQAILDANANPSFNIIGFNIPGSCPQTIAVNTELPAISDGVAIRGYTQAGSHPNSSSLIDNATICVELVEASGHTVLDGLHFTPATDDDTLDVSGLAIGGFNTGVFIDHTDTGTGVGHRIWGNFIGLAADGTASRPNTFAGIDVRGRVYGTIGGDDVAQRNVIAGALAGVRVDADQSNFIVGNFIGTTKSGGVARPNAIGVILLSGLHQVIGNVISGNGTTGVSLSGPGAILNTVDGNRIGLKAFAICAMPPCAPGYDALGNGDSGVSIADGARDNTVTDDTLAWNGGAGVRVSGSGSAGNTIAGNRIHDNDGLGIDLGSLGVDPVDNDATAASDAPNHGLNAPELVFSRGGHASGHAYGRLRSIDGAYRIELYASATCDGSGHGEGRDVVGAGDIEISGAPNGDNGEAWFDLAIASSQDLVGRAITAVATVPRDGSAHAGDTSEFSACVTHAFVDLIFADGFDPPLP
ncbi:MAG TPA: right-handed parallel beta-helix repeat-containing protein [Dokdonella sp.]|nr:right-handed parallel beta-helix repeat-containing protein [Dokdonella sp.]